MWYRVWKTFFFSLAVLLSSNGTLFKLGKHPDTHFFSLAYVTKFVVMFK